MLYDPKWETPAVKADPFSLESLIAWLEKQPAEQQYDPLDPMICMAGQFAAAMGAPCASDKSLELTRRGGPFERAAYGPIGDDPGDYTFGAALTRARKALANYSDAG